MRAAGNKPYYTFVLLDENTGRTRKGVTIELPSSTTIVKQTLAAPQLVNWAYTQTRDNISGLVEVSANRTLISADDIVDTLSDAEMLEEWLKDNRLRPDDVKNERAEEGRERHALFERLAQAQMSSDDDADVRIASRMVEDDDGWTRGIGQWWLDKLPRVVATEHVLPCPQYGYCGTLDIAWDPNLVTVTDLKTRKEGGTAYESDFFQIDSYKTAWNILRPDTPAVRSTALVVRADGTYVEEENLLPDGSFLKLMDVWLLNKRLAAERKRKEN